MNEGKELQLVTFESTSAKEILAKLHREIERIHNDANAKFAADHVINAFWTAWLMHVWIWDAIKDQSALRDAVIKYRGIEEEKISDSSSFGTALARRFVPLKICRKIAMGARHVQVVYATEDGSADNQPLDSEESSRHVGNSDNKSARERTADMRNAPMVIVMGRPISVIQLLREVEDYWITLIHENGIEQLR